jgi:protein TonB
MPTELKEIDRLKPATGPSVASPEATGQTASVRPQPVALEVPVTVNGARTGADGKREPFSESTNTVLVFGNGTVIRLSANVVPGQLLFLTNEKNRKEVICQVLKTKSYDNVSGYVELGFTEPAPAFWGMRFAEERPAAQPQTPATAAPQPARPPVKVEAPKEVTAEPVAQKRPLPPSGAQPALPVNIPNRTVATQLTTSTPPSAPPPKAVPVARASSTASQVPKAAPVMVTSTNPKLEALKLPVAAPPSRPDGGNQEPRSLLPTVDPVPPAVKTPSISATLPKVDIESTLISEEVKIPKWLEPLARNAATALAPASVSVPTPKEAIPDTSRVLDAEAEKEIVALTLPEPQRAVLSAPGSFGQTLVAEASEFPEQVVLEVPRKSNIALRLIALAAGVVVAAAGYMWYQRQNSGNSVASGSPAAPVSVVSPNRPAGAQGEAAKPVVQKETSQSEPAGQYVAPGSQSSPKSSQQQASQQAVVPPTSIEQAAKVTRSSTKVPAEAPKPTLGEVRLAGPTSNSNSAAGTDAGPAPEVNGNVPANDALAAGLASSNKQPARPPDPLPVGGDVKPARMVKSVPPIYPLIAKNQRVAGDVLIDAVIDPAGSIASMKVVSGPVLLHQAARDALRQWKYQAATLDGKPVAMTVRVTIEFRLDQ